MPRKNSQRKLYTVAEANATLPLLRAILRDVVALATELRERYQRLKVVSGDGPHPMPMYQEEADQITHELERGQVRMEELENELRDLDIELKDYFTGLIDFRHWMDDHEVYLCWKLGEPEVAHWHELDAGFQGRQKLDATVHQH